MGFFSKVFKKVKKGFKGVFKSIGKGIKSAFKKFGKFMGKIGIVGQLAMSFVLPGIGQALMGKVGAGFSKLTGALAKGGKIAQAAGKVLEAGASFAKAGHSAFKTVTEGISNFVGEFSKTALKKIPGMDKLMPSLTNANDNFFKVDANGNSAWNTVQSSITENASAVVSNFKAGLENFGAAGKVFTATGANALQASQALVGAGGGTIPNVTAPKVESQSLLADPKAATTGVGPMREGYQLPGTPDRSFDLGMKGPEDLAKTFDVTLDARGLPDAELVSTPTTGGINTRTAAPTNMRGASQAGANARFTNFDPTKSVYKEPKGFFSNLLGEAKAGLKENYAEFLDGRSLTKAVVQEGSEALFDNTVEGVTSGVQQKAYDSVVGTPEAPVSYGTYVEAYQPVGIDNMASPEINDRAMQMSISPQAYMQQNPYGYAANIYQEQMRIKAGGVA